MAFTSGVGGVSWFLVGFCTKLTWFFWTWLCQAWRGGETYDKMREINSHLKILLASGYSIDGEAKEILERGCDGFIQRPFSIGRLSNKIREILDAGNE